MWEGYGPKLAKAVRQGLSDPAVKDVSVVVMRDAEGNRKVIVTTEYDDGKVIADKTPMSLPDVAAPVAGIAARIKSERSRRT